MKEVPRMGLFRRKGPSEVAETITAPEARSADLGAMYEALMRGGGSGTAGQVVTVERASHLMAVWRCQHMIADIVSGLPVHEFRERNGRKQQVARSAFVESPSNLLDAHEWRYALLLDAAAHGNAVAVVTASDAQGWPLKAELVSWSDVQVRQLSGALSPPTYKVAGKAVDVDKVMHFRAFGPKAGTVLGLSPISYARETIGLGLAVREFGAQWYESGGHPTTVLSTEQDVDDDDLLKAKNKFREATRGDHIAAVGNGWDLKSVQVAPDDALFLAATNATAVDICGYYGMPPELLGYAASGKGSLTYANREQRAIDVLVFTLQWWIGRLERLISAQLPNGRYVKISIDGFLRSDATTRWAIHETAQRLGVRSRNEIRELEDESPLPEGGNEFVWPPVHGATPKKTDPAPPAGGEEP